MESKKILIAFIMLSLAFFTAEKQVFIDYGVGGQGRELMRYFYDVEDAFYVDVGAYDPIFASNTLNLYTKGWGGINIDAHPGRLARFFMCRPDQTNLNFAIGDSDTFVTLYEVDEDSSSTVSPKVKDYIQSFKPVLQQIKVPSLSLKQVCQRYYYRKPIFMNLDIEGYGSKALQSNDWSNPLCVPEVIFSEINEETRQSGLPLPEQVLKKLGYIKQPRVVGLNQIYIHESVSQKYLDKQKKAEEYLSNLQFIGIDAIAIAVAQHLSRTTILFKHYEPTTDRIFHKFAKHNQVIDLNNLNEVSNQLNTLESDRPIIIYHYNPSKNALIVSQGQFISKETRIQNYLFLEVQVTKGNGKKFNAYVYNHEYENAKGKKPTVLSSAKQAYLLESSKQFKPTVPAPAPVIQNLTAEQKEEQKLIQKTISILVQELKNQEKAIGEIEGISQKKSKELKDTFVGHHNVEINILEQIGKKVQSFEGKLQPEISPKGKSTVKSSKELSANIKNLKIIQFITLGLIIVMSMSLCITVCVLKKTKRRPRYSQVDKLGVSESSMVDSEK